MKRSKVRREQAPEAGLEAGLRFSDEARAWSSSPCGLWVGGRKRELNCWSTTSCSSLQLWLWPLPQSYPILISSQSPHWTPTLLFKPSPQEYVSLLSPWATALASCLSAASACPRCPFLCLSSHLGLPCEPPGWGNHRPREKRLQGRSQSKKRSSTWEASTTDPREGFPAAESN